MLLKNVTNYIEKLLAEREQMNEVQELALFEEEKAYVEKHHIRHEEQKNLIVKDSMTRFQGAYIERCDKESDEIIAEESDPFLEKPISYFKTHKEEFMYMESPWFDLIGADAVSFEADSVFGTYDVMLGLKLPKKTENAIKTYLTNNLHKEEASYDLMFNSSDGLWDFNFSLNSLNEYHEEWTINEAYCAIYHFLFQLVATVEAKV
ncbi:branched-chain amino acid aminotransferase [Bacillus benzoevorans]|uniref:Branched-chain amino acid aminotransferase n=1 Tax=Bacillus benzoevorans TaxID=1456 RepID=A0A7X0HR25_9BACI|nr:branched-chain amino acid aminotransferase [Bacillus benzoevorans]MBB6445239.1 hypothetical protein [Bacillus benzoevorans]